MIKRSVFIIFFLLLCFSLFSEEYIDVVTTHEGNIYKGIIIENKINDYIKIELPGGSIFRLKYSDIDIIAKEKKVSDSGDDTSIVINNSNTNTQEQTNTQETAVTTTISNDLISSVVPYTDYELISLLEKTSLKQLKTTHIDYQRINATDLGIRQNVYRITEKKSPALYMLGNLLLPGVGSFLQGNIGIGVYDSLSYIVYLGAYVSYISSNDIYYEGPSVFLTAAAVNFLVAYITGLVSPFTYGNSYNSELSSKLLTMRY